MSAIAGILYFDGALIASGLIGELTNAMSSRGPDEQNHWSSNDISLGHCMLRTTPESLEEHQPLTDQSNRFVIVWDGRLDNRNELYKAVITHGGILRNTSDAELVLQSYIIWREDSPKHLLGDFAFAIWDSTNKRLFCARDHVGARPLYYTHSKRFFAFASEEEPLLGLPGVTYRPNDDWIASIFVPEFDRCIDPKQSWIDDICIFESGQSSTIDSSGNINFTKYWQLEPDEEIRFRSDEEYREAFVDIFEQSVRCRMRTIDDVGMMASGGLDSASIFYTAKRLLTEFPGKSIHTYSAISDHPEHCIESRCIQTLTDGLADRAHFVSLPSLTGMISIEDLINFAWSKAHPVDNSVLLPGIMCLAASRQGHRVLLHGVSGDLTCYSPTRYHAYLLRDKHFKAAWRESVEASRNHTYLRDSSSAILMLKSMWTAYAPRSVKIAKLRLLQILHRIGRYNDLIHPEFVKKLHLEEKLAEVAQSNLDSRLLDHQNAHINTLFPLGFRIGLEAYDRVAGRSGIELRDPWADRRVVEFFTRLPLEQKVRHGWTKYLVRTTLIDEQNAMIKWRRGKEHLGWHLHMQLAAKSDRMLTQLFADKMCPIQKYVIIPRVLEYLRQFKATRSPEAADRCVYSAALALWLERST